MAAASQSAEAKQSLHANAVAFEEAGILIRGEARAGKSSLCFALMKLAEDSGRFCRLVGDDRIIVERQADRLIARGHPAIQGMIERRGEGIIRVPFEPTVVLSLVIDLVPADELPCASEAEGSQAEICGVKLPRLALPAGRSSYDCALAVLARLHQTETI
ncbi:MAG: HPr kinase/phosphatase C-terminal domain-containing protein [Methylovirgula sp.]|jgi:serine kinase of HPr protein (carbohydrate metabolism regulator)